ncbi:hypothetical protein [Kaarinaea lacus]
MIRIAFHSILCSLFLIFSTASLAVPPVTGEPIIVQHLGKVEWPQDDPVTTPYLTQLSANDINDLHGEVTCDVIISTPGNYHMALLEAMKGRSDLGHIGLQEQVKTQFDATVCWSTSPPVSVDQISAEDLQFKNIHLQGRPALAMGPGGVMNSLVGKGLVDVETRQPFLRNKGNVILIRADKAKKIKNICDLGGKIRVATPNPALEPGSFGNFSGTIFNVADQNDFGCDATKLFNSIFSQDISKIDTSGFDNPYDINGVLAVFGVDKKHHHKKDDDDGKNKKSMVPKWIASSRIMHRDIPYALCHNEADAGVIFYHQAKYLKRELASTGCRLAIVPLGGSETDPQPLPGNRVGTLHIAKVAGTFPQKVLDARDLVYNFLTSSPIWTQIMADHGMVDPTP